MTVRYYSSVAPETTLSTGITNSSTTIQVGSAVGLPTNTPFTIAIDYEGATEELVNVTAVALTTLTVDRGIDGTSAAAHNAGARVRHVSSARDFTDSRTHENSANGVHGLSPGEDLVGTLKTQSLSNKTLVNATGSLTGITINNVGTTQAKIVGDPASPGAQALSVQPDNASAITFSIFNNGATKMVNTVTIDSANMTYRHRVTKSNTTTDIFAVFSGGQVTSTLNNGANGFTLNASPDNVKRFAFQVMAPDTVTQRSVIYTDGSALFKTTNSAAPTMSVQGVSGQTVTFQTTDFAGVPAFQVDNIGNITTGNVNTVGNVAISGSLTASGIQFAPMVSAAGTSIFSVASGWSLSSAQGARVGGMTTVVVGFQRTGSTIPAGADGNIPGDPQVGVIQPIYRPNAVITQAMMGVVADGGGAGSVRINTDGSVDFLSWAPNGTINNTSIYRFQFSYPSN